MKEYVCFFKNSWFFYKFWEIAARWCLQQQDNVSRIKEKDQFSWKAQIVEFSNKRAFGIQNLPMGRSDLMLKNMLKNEIFQIEAKHEWSRRSRLLESSATRFIENRRRMLPEMSSDRFGKQAKLCARLPSQQSVMLTWHTHWACRVGIWLGFKNGQWHRATFHILICAELVIIYWSVCCWLGGVTGGRHMAQP